MRGSMSWSAGLGETQLVARGVRNAGSADERLKASYLQTLPLPIRLHLPCGAATARLSLQQIG